MRRAIEVAEMVAVGEADKEELLTEWQALTPLQELHDNPDVNYEELTAAYMVDALLFRNASAAAHGMEFVDSAKEAETVHLLRDVFGNIFNPARLHPRWKTQSIKAIAQAAYDERGLPSGELNTARLAILSDALEEAGCTDAILHHLRSPGPHVRGCWALDAVLAKE